jgi:hypothetical protein
MPYKERIYESHMVLRRFDEEKERRTGLTLILLMWRIG